jgi:hypothetical protein
MMIEDPNNFSISKNEMESWLKCWLNLKEENEQEVIRLANILKRTNKNRIKKKLGRRIAKLCMK